MTQPPAGDFAGVAGAMLLSSLSLLLVVVAVWIRQLDGLGFAIARQICEPMARTRYPLHRF